MNSHHDKNLSKLKYAQLLYTSQVFALTINLNVAYEQAITTIVIVIFVMLQLLWCCPHYLDLEPRNYMQCSHATLTTTI